MRSPHIAIPYHHERCNFFHGIHLVSKSVYSERNQTFIREVHKRIVFVFFFTPIKSIHDNHMPLNDLQACERQQLYSQGSRKVSFSILQANKNTDEQMDGQIKSQINGQKDGQANPFIGK